MKYYKVLGEKSESTNGGEAKWKLGQWMPPIKDNLVPCINGYHLCRKADLIDWLGPRIFLVETKGKIVREDDKVVVAEARIISEFTSWNEKTARLFAADCAEHSLKYWLKKYPDDDRPAKAIEAARLFARGKIRRKKLNVAWAAAWDAAGDAAGAAARATARATAWAAAGAAAGATAWAAAAAAGAAAAAERKWQTKRLFEYLEGKHA